MSEITEIFGEICFKVLGFSLILVLGALIIFLPFAPDESPTDDELKKQILCEHKWREIDDFAFWVTIYCPVCEKEEFIENSEWNKIKAKADYEQNHVVK